MRCWKNVSNIYCMVYYNSSRSPKANTRAFVLPIMQNRSPTPWNIKMYKTGIELGNVQALGVSHFLSTVAFWDCDSLCRAGIIIPSAHVIFKFLLYVKSLSILLLSNNKQHFLFLYLSPFLWDCFQTFAFSSPPSLLFKHRPTANPSIPN